MISVERVEREGEFCSGREKEYVTTIKSWTLDKLESEWKRLDQMYHAKATDVDVTQRRCTPLALSPSLSLSLSLSPPPHTHTHTHIHWAQRAKQARGMVCRKDM